jgi:hypothetical protein
VRIDDMVTDWFTIDCGVRQEESLDPLLFAIFINDLAIDINNLNLGIETGIEEEISILMYADDIVLMADNEDNLQKMLDTLNNWTTLWHLEVNLDKTKVMHCRKQSTQVTDRNVHSGMNTLNTCTSYRYLGFEVFETCDYTDGVKLLNAAGSRAIWALTAKHYNTKGLSFQVIEKLYFNTVVPVTDYASEIWGYKKYDFLDRLQFRAARTFLGVGKGTTI